MCPDPRQCTWSCLRVEEKVPFCLYAEVFFFHIFFFKMISRLKLDEVVGGFLQGTQEEGAGAMM